MSHPFGASAPVDDEITGEVRSQVGGWAMVPIWTLDYLTPGELKIYVTLRTYADQKGYAYPKTKTIAERSGMSVGSVRNAVQKMRELGMVATEERRRLDGSIAGLDYYLADIDPQTLHLVEGKKSTKKAKTETKSIGGVHHRIDKSQPAETDIDAAQNLYTLECRPLHHRIDSITPQKNTPVLLKESLNTKKDSIDAGVRAHVREEQQESEEGKDGGNDFSFLSSKDEEQNQNRSSQPQGENPIMVPTSGNRAKPKAGKDEKEPSSGALAMVAGLRWAVKGWTVSRSEARRLAVRVDEVMEDEQRYTIKDLQVHLNARLSQCHTAPVAYLLGALSEDGLPALPPDVPENPFWSASVDSGPVSVSAGIEDYGLSEMAVVKPAREPLPDSTQGRKMANELFTQAGVSIRLKSIEAATAEAGE